MDVSRFSELKLAPRAVFDRLEALRARPRFMLPTPSGDWRAVTWGAFAAEIRAIARYLTGEGLVAGGRAAIYAGNRVEWMSAALAIQAAGGVMVPIYPASTAEQVGFVAGHSDARILFVDGAALLGRLLRCWSALGEVKRVVLLDDAVDVLAVASELRAKGVELPPYSQLLEKVIPWSRALAQGRAFDLDRPGGFQETMDAVSLDQPGVMLYTSGTSGNPKGVPLSHRNIGVNGRDWLQCNAPLLEEGAVDLLWLPMSHIFGFGEACLGNTLGFTSYLVDPAQAMARLPEVQPQVFMSVPSVWEKLAVTAQSAGGPEVAKAKLMALTGGKLRFCLSGGAGLKREVKDFFHAAGLLIIEGYGLTETSPTLTLNRPDAFRFDSVGKVLPSVELKLAEDGEILAKGQSVFRGYHKDPAATRESFTDDGWFKTGDVGRFTDDGFLQIIDRKKDILVTAGGKNVAPANIELRFRDDPLIAHAVVFGDGQRYLVAGIWLNEGAVPPDATPEKLQELVQRSIDKVNGEVAGFESIKKFAILSRPLTVEGGLLTSTLKVRRRKVYEAFHGELEALYR
jgi:long-chain acyl-CoA synthetase